LNGLQFGFGLDSGPRERPSMPSGNSGRAMLPMARAVKAVPSAKIVGR
jgi:hypothetical protein